MSYLHPETISRLSRLDLIARLVVEGFITGLHRSPYHGFSVEFSEHRPYLPGDPLRDLDWKAYAKSDRLYVKQYEEETNLKAYLLLDVSGSMDFAAGAPPEQVSLRGLFGECVGVSHAQATRCGGPVALPPPNRGVRSAALGAKPSPSAPQDH